jgi:hypothetical protein
MGGSRAMAPCQKRRLRSRDFPSAQGFDERLLIDDRAARRVEQPRRGLHERQRGASDETAGALAQEFILHLRQC